MSALKEFFLCFITYDRKFSSSKTFSSIASILAIILFTRDAYLNGLKGDMLLIFAGLFISQKALGTFSSVYTKKNMSTTTKKEEKLPEAAKKPIHVPKPKSVADLEPSD